MVVRAGGIQILNNVTGSAHGSLHVMITPLIHSTKLSHVLCRISMLKGQINHTHLMHDAYANSPPLIFRSTTSHTQTTLDYRWKYNGVCKATPQMRMLILGHRVKSVFHEFQSQFSITTSRVAFESGCNVWRHQQTDGPM